MIGPTNWRTLGDNGVLLHHVQDLCERWQDVLGFGWPALQPVYAQLETVQGCRGRK